MAWQRPTRLLMGSCIVEIDQVNRWRNEEIIVKCNFGWVWSMWVGRPRIDRIVKREVQYHLEVNRCRNKEIIVKGNFGCGLCGRGAPGLVMVPCIVEIDLIVIREVQDQLEVNRFRNEEVIVKGNLGGCGLCGRGAPGLVMGPFKVEIDHIVIREVQYQF
ncbi:hypothetical protein DPMN_029730 [Dreissena polymorpha]|uniref:Uncharacterized protein n=1 Tax=Dreissena polymorpha TaxID=45954 RepID=A0A9D4LWY4_DREPO|nr:hypothetical protein DPMN_029730 [Dreissena polymorpha]